MLVYVIFHCDEWKSYDSRRLIGTATKSSLQHVLNVIKRKKKYSDEDMQTYIDIDETFTNDVESMNI